MKTDFLIIGGGMVGLSIANQILEKGISKKIIIIDKEPQLGMHSSGRNSGVLHAGIYYKPNTLKSKVCVEGSKRLKDWVIERKLTINFCGKVIVPQKIELDQQLDKLLKRGQSNGADVSIINDRELKEIVPFARSASGRALWSPNTCVVKPLEIVSKLEKELNDKGVKIFKGVNINQIILNENSLKLSNSKKFNFEYLVNCAGLQADNIAHKLGLFENYKILPFRGLYWEFKKDAPFKLKTNLYPVPDLNVPFLGVHFTPNADNTNITIGPTALLALGRENYRGIKNIEPLMALNNLMLLGKQFIQNKGNFRRYVNEQLFLSLTPLMLDSARKIIPEIRSEHIKLSKKVGIRAQLFNKEKSELVDDFLCLKHQSSIHVLNAISPAFTASFELADLILEKI